MAITVARGTTTRMRENYDSVLLRVEEGPRGRGAGAAGDHRPHPIPRRSLTMPIVPHASA